MQVKTITTVAGVNEIDFGNDDSQTTAHFYWFKNLSNSTLYVSAVPDPVAGEDNVAELSAKGAASVETDEGKVYVLGAGKVEIHRTNSKFCPFELPSTGSGGGGGGAITVDSELSETSENPLQNKATTAAINEIKSELDTKSDVNHIHDITASGNPVTLTNLQGEVPFSGITVSGKNLLKYPYYSGENLTVNNVDFTVNPDGSIHIKSDGAVVGKAVFWLENATSAFVPPKNTPIYISASDNQISNINIGYGRLNGTTWISAKTMPLTGGVEIFDYGNFDRVVFNITVYAGDPVDVTLYPQIELGTTPTAYEPPITGRELTVNVCGKNIIAQPSWIEQQGGTISNNGITYTLNDDKSITANGTATADSYCVLHHLTMSENVNRLTKNTDYFLSGSPVGSGANTYQIYAGIYDNDGNRVGIYHDYGSGVSIKIANDYRCVLSITIAQGQTVDNLVFRPQLEIGSVATDYEPYHGSVTTITPDSNPYIIPNDIRQQEGLNNISVSAGKLSVTGVRKNAAIKKIWGNMGMDLLFDGTVTTGTNCITESINEYNFLYFYGNLSSVSGASGNVTGSLVVPKTARAISAGQSLVVTTGVTYITVNIINIESGVITFTVTPNDSSREIYEFKVFGIK